MVDLLEDVERYIRRYGLLARGASVVVGVSGGPDSLCLLHLLYRLAPAWALRLHVAHLDHGLRGKAGADEARFVGELAAEWGLPCTVARAGVSALAAQTGVSQEDAARRARYRYLARVAAEQGAATIAVGHQADDQAETVLLRFLRGSGVSGLRGMEPKLDISKWDLLASELQGEGRQAGHVWEPAPAGSSDAPLWLVRPLLAVSRSVIESYCAGHGLAPRRDASNEDTDFTRNRVRHELLPLLAAYNPEIRSVLARTAEIMAGEQEVLEAAAREAWAACLRAAEPQAVVFDLAAWRRLPLGLQRAVLRRGVAYLRGSLRDIGWQHLEPAVWLAWEGGAGRQAGLPGGLVLKVGYDSLRLAWAGEPAPAGDVLQVAAPVVLAAPGVTKLAGDWSVEVRRATADELPAGLSETAALPADSAPTAWSAWLDAEATGPVLTLRPRRPGDRFQPLGLSGHSIRVAEYMIDAKVPRALRDGWPVLEGARGIAWVCGLRVDQRAAITLATRAAWHMEFWHDGVDRDRHLDHEARES